MSRELIEAAKAVLDLLDPNDCLRSGARIGEWIRATDALRAAVRAAEAATNCGGDGYFTQRENTDAEKNAASQYADGLVSLSGDEGSFHGTRKNVHEAVRLAFLAGARSRDEAAPVADEERVKDVAVKVRQAIINAPGSYESVLAAICDAIRPYIAPALVADTVAVPVAAIRHLKSTVSSFGVGVPDWARRARKAADDITKLLPPPPAPEPSAELRERWWSEAMDVFHAAAGISREEFDLIEARREGYVAARRAEWVRTQKGGG